MAEEDNSEKILKDFDEIRPIHEAFTSKMDGLIKDLLSDASISVHSVTSRTKNRESLRNKLTKGAEKYQALTDIMDVSGIRITCWFLDQIPLIEKIINENFLVRQDLSIDKGGAMDPDRFGYVSVHYIVSLSPSRNQLQEFKKYTGLYFEIQIRTILQHAWAEVEHDLGYKSQIEIPRDIKRRFARLASIFELADDEFQRLKKDIGTYSELVEEKIKRKEQDIFIDRTSLESYLKSSEIIKKLDQVIVGYFGDKTKLGDIQISERDLQILNFFKINTIENLDQLLRENSTNILNMAKKWITTKHESIRGGIAIFYLGYTLAAKTRNERKIKEYFILLGFNDQEKLVKKLMAISNELYPQIIKQQ